MCIQKQNDNWRINYSSKHKENNSLVKYIEVGEKKPEKLFKINQTIVV